MAVPGAAGEALDPAGVQPPQQLRADPLPVGAEALQEPRRCCEPRDPGSSAASRPRTGYSLRSPNENRGSRRRRTKSWYLSSGVSPWKLAPELRDLDLESGRAADDRVEHACRLDEQHVGEPDGIENIRGQGRRDPLRGGADLGQALHHERLGQRDERRSDGERTRRGAVLALEGREDTAEPGGGIAAAISEGLVRFGQETAQPGLTVDAIERQPALEPSVGLEGRAGSPLGKDALGSLGESLLLGSIAGRDARRALQREAFRKIQRTVPDVIHCNTCFPRLSPATCGRQRPDGLEPIRRQEVLCAEPRKDDQQLQLQFESVRLADPLLPDTSVTTVTSVPVPVAAAAPFVRPPLTESRSASVRRPSPTGLLALTSAFSASVRLLK